MDVVIYFVSTDKKVVYKVEVGLIFRTVSRNKPGALQLSMYTHSSSPPHQLVVLLSGAMNESYKCIICIDLHAILCWISRLVSIHRAK